MNFDEKCQLLILGDSTVGKTSLMIRYTEEAFSDQYTATVGLDYMTKDEHINGKIIRVKIFDSAGQERYRSLTRGFLRLAEGTVLVYDVSNTDSFDNLKYWIKTIQSSTEDFSSLQVVIFGNKVDEVRIVNEEDANNFAKVNGIQYFEGSAKTGVSVNECFRYIIEEIIKNKNNSRKSFGKVIVKNKDKAASRGRKCNC